MKRCQSIFHTPKQFKRFCGQALGVKSRLAPFHHLPLIESTVKVTFCEFKGGINE